MKNEIKWFKDNGWEVEKGADMIRMNSSDGSYSYSIMIGKAGMLYSTYYHGKISGSIVPYSELYHIMNIINYLRSGKDIEV